MALKQTQISIVIPLLNEDGNIRVLYNALIPVVEKIAADYEINSYSKKMEWALCNPDKLQTIANNSYLVGCNHFDIQGYSSKIEKFLTVS